MVQPCSYGRYLFGRRATPDNRRAGAIRGRSFEQSKQRPLYIVGKYSRFDALWEQGAGAGSRGGRQKQRGPAEDLPFSLPAPCSCSLPRGAIRNEKVAFSGHGIFLAGIILGQVILYGAFRSAAGRSFWPWIFSRNRTSTFPHRSQGDVLFHKAMFYPTRFIPKSLPGSLR